MGDHPVRSEFLNRNIGVAEVDRDYRHAGGAGKVEKLINIFFLGNGDGRIIDGIGVNGPAILARMLSYPARLFEWGQVQWYALVMTAGLVGFVFYYVYH